MTQRDHDDDGDDFVDDGDDGESPLVMVVVLMMIKMAQKILRAMLMTRRNPVLANYNPDR